MIYIELNLSHLAAIVISSSFLGMLFMVWLSEKLEVMAMEEKDAHKKI